MPAQDTQAWRLGRVVGVAVGTLAQARNLGNWVAVNHLAPCRHSLELVAKKQTCAWILRHEGNVFSAGFDAVDRLKFMRWSPSRAEGL